MDVVSRVRLTRRLIIDLASKILEGARRGAHGLVKILGYHHTIRLSGGNCRITMCCNDYYSMFLRIYESYIIGQCTVSWA